MENSRTRNSTSRSVFHLIILFSSPILFLTLACAEPIEDVSVISFSNNVLLISPLGAKDKAFPGDLVDFLMPLTVDACPGMVFVGDITVTRQDLEPPNETLLNLDREESWLEAVQAFIGRKATLSQIEMKRGDSLRKLTIPSLLAQHGPAREDMSLDHLSSILSHMSQDNLYVLGLPTEFSDALATDAKVIARQTSADLRKHLASDLCEDFNLEQSKNLGVTTVYVPTSERSHETRSDLGSETKHEEPQHLTPEETFDRIRVEKEYEELARRVRSASQADRGAVDQALRDAEKNFPHDYRFTYERAKLAVYGYQRHDPAFSLMAEAAEKAIVNGQGTKMLDHIEREQSSVRALIRLANGHEEQWDPILEALRTRNTSLLAPILRGEHGH